MKQAFLLNNGLSEENYCTLKTSQIRIPKEENFYAAWQKRGSGRYVRAASESDIF